MNVRKKTILLFAIAAVTPVVAQIAKQPMSFDDLTGWKRITEQLISDDGKWVACKMEPCTGDAIVRVFNAKGEETASFEPAGKIAFSSSCNYLLVTQRPALKRVEALKLKKTKEEDMPMDQLILYNLSAKCEERIDSIKSYKLSDAMDWIAWQRGTKTDSALYIRSLKSVQPTVFPAVTDFHFAKEGNVLYYVSTGDSLGTKAGLYIYDLEKTASRLIYEGEGVFKHVAFTKKGDKLAFLYCADKDSTATCLSLYVSGTHFPATVVANKQHPVIPENWVISEHEAVRFSDDAERLFFGVAPQPKQKDTTILDENRPKVEVWKWDEGVQYTQQKYNKETDLKKACTAVYNFSKDEVVLLSSTDKPDLILSDKGNASVGLLTTSQPYDLERMWVGRSRYDVYTVDMETGGTQRIKEALLANVHLSPKGKYACWYNPEDSSWYTWSIVDKKEYRLTTPASFPAWDEDNDMPDYPRPYGIAGWTKDDEYILLYDRYDICQFHPKANEPPVNLTRNGRDKQIAYRYISLDKEKTAIDRDSLLLLSGFHRQTKGYGYYEARFSSPAAPVALLAGDFMLSTPLKAKKADAVIYTLETFGRYPDIRLADLSFKRSVQLTEGYKQQQNILWGNAELVSWTSLDGKPLQGVVYKPENFDPQKKYPLLVNFYERNSDARYAYRMPEPHRSTLDYHFYNSNGYILFNPDIAYKEGYPGESCFNSVMPGISLLISEGYINEKAIGAQGHSWGGYQVAYLATRTNLFAAIESGAPVVNMFSAYGGIRWGSGLNRSFQYERTQSRIGATIWESPLRYLENSPLFTMDKVETPVLIMHNDNDGHVPWYQGIEYFVALKRLQKPVWLLNYTGEVHWPVKTANRVDFQKRMFQFFEHYLKGTPMPQWMDEGIPAVDQDFGLGY
ncbi:MAG: prolyl oligopeptidase family serine peptidase [Tannerellaceae bacterium]|jgi:dipeptidyl aminopeptidase/acylaminoacyl peptidase|nr:prolyl oligopeptidase family serine peptidase [Tannerellaceae bacterium]